MDIRIPEFDLLTAGFPCQPFSVAGKQIGESDSRNKWPSTIRAIRLLRPRYALLENVPGILSVGRPAYFGRILGDLAESGYNAQWDCIPASAIGAPHRRDRVFIIAYNHSVRCLLFSQKEIRRISGFSWCENVRGAEDYRNRPDLPKPLIRGKSDGIPHHVDRLRCLGNAVVPQVVTHVGRCINDAIEEGII